MSGLDRRTMSPTVRRPWWRRAGRQVVLVVVAVLVSVTVGCAAYDLTSARTLPVPPLDAHGHWVRTGPLKTHYEQWGSRGRPVVLVHGVLESSATWSRVGPLLARDGYRVYALDVRGYGYTQRRGPYTLASDTAQLRDFLAALHLDARHRAAPVLVGHSSGAAIVGDLARTDPSGVRSVVFMDGDGTPYGVGPAFLHKAFVDPYATAAIRLLTRHLALARSVYRNACGPGCPPFDAGVWIRPLEVPGAEAALKAIFGQQLIGLTYAQERQIHVPAAVVYGEHDDVMPPATARRTAQDLHTRTVVVLAGAGHLGMVSDPAMVARVLARLAG